MAAGLRLDPRGELTALYIGEEREVKGVLEEMGGVAAGNDRQGLCSFKNSIGNI